MSRKLLVLVSALLFIAPSASYSQATAPSRSKARVELGWVPSMSFEQLVKLMVDSDMELARQELTLSNAGHRVIVRGRAHA